MDALESRAGDLLDRLTDCGVGDGLTEEDLYGGAAREPLRSCCTKLAEKLWALGQCVEFANLRSLQGAVNDIRQAASSEQAAGRGRLDACLIRLAQVLDRMYTPATPSISAAPAAAAHASSSGSGRRRLESVELLTAVLQGATLLAAAAQDQQRAQAAAARALAGASMPAAAPLQAPAGGEAETLDPLAMELSRALRGLAALLEVQQQPPGSGCGAAGAAAAGPLVASLRVALEGLLARLPHDFFAPMLPRSALSEQQLATLGDVNTELHDEYALRRRMLIERAKVTLKSFLWSGRLAEKGTKSEAQTAVDAAAQLMSPEPTVALDDLFCTTAGDLLSVMERATSGETGVGASVKAVLIGSVPDRGGRPEGRARVADMPEWTARRVSEGGGRGRGGRGAWHGGGKRVQGGWQGGAKGVQSSSGDRGGGQWGHSGGRGGGPLDLQGAAKRGRSGH